jgi:hypothetical protein
MQDSLSPCADEAHQKGARKNNNAGNDALLAAEDLPAFIAKEIFGEELDEGGVDEEAGGDGVHGSDEDEAEGRVGVVEAMSCKADGLADRGAVVGPLADGFYIA